MVCKQLMCNGHNCRESEDGFSEPTKPKSYANGNENSSISRVCGTSGMSTEPSLSHPLQTSLCSAPHRQQWLQHFITVRAQCNWSKKYQIAKVRIALRCCGPNCATFPSSACTVEKTSPLQLCLFRGPPPLETVGQVLLHSPALPFLILL